MTKQSSIPSAHAHIAHASKRDTHGKFLPEHEHCFPERPRDTRNNDEPAVPRTDVPGTGTPDVIRQAHLQEDAFERSERIAAGESIAPVEDSTEWIEPEQDDRLDVEVVTHHHS